MRIKMKRSRDGPELWVPVCSTEREAMELELEEITRIWCHVVKSFVKGKESQPDSQQTARNSGYVNKEKKNKQTLPRQDEWLEDRGGKGRAEETEVGSPCCDLLPFAFRRPPNCSFSFATSKLWTLFLPWSRTAGEGAALINKLEKTPSCLKLTF